MAANKGDKARGLNRTTKIGETELANDRMGRNSLQGDDQTSVRNQRKAQPDATTDPDGVMESFKKLDKDERARKDLGKGNRSSK